MRKRSKIRSERWLDENLPADDGLVLVSTWNQKWRLMEPEAVRQDIYQGAGYEAFDRSPPGERRQWWGDRPSVAEAEAADATPASRRRRLVNKAV